ncbi:NUDIX hydrolase domain-like protein [Cristinia sonorae]|uniref:NUDIX hydrolase domain-like protein n=1 Tax=Cristinia sonorae TaxID=1940300 RepID=A0A8K0USB3_9AGAR|nr:NUDIX hydrolase domain-like protein [Cristinia sonorae]
MSPIPKSYLDIVQVCDNFSLASPERGSDEPAAQFCDEPLVTWRLSPEPSSPAIGLLRPCVVEELRKETSGNWSFLLDGERPYISLSSALDTPAKRSAAMKELCERWRDGGIFPGQISPKKWRGEMYPVYRKPFGPMDAPQEGADVDEDSRNYAFMMERAACSVFGVVTYGVHMTVYHEEVIDGERSCRIWVPRRAKTKQTWPGLFDNTVAGGIPSGLSVFECTVKESMEEASIPEDIVRTYAQPVGVISYFYRTTAGWLQPEVEYVYDIRIPSHVPFEPKPSDGEVESFECLPMADVIPLMLSRQFKPNCAMVILDFMIRLGFLLPEDEPNYLEIVTRLHGRFDYDKW